MTPIGVVRRQRVKFNAVSSLRYAVATVQGYQPLRASLVCAEECLSPEI